MGFYALNLTEMRGENQGRQRKMPFEHQLDAFKAMSSTFEFDGRSGKGALLVLPTGAGKTFTAVNGSAITSSGEISRFFGSPIPFTCWIKPARSFTRMLAGYPSHERH
jgi:hypothetical protein